MPSVLFRSDSNPLGSLPEDMETKAEDTPAASTSASGGNDGSSPESTKPASKPLRRACDCCRKRKVKCDGEEPCSPCKRASIRCAYLQPPKKKGPKGLRSARVLHALRRIDDQASGGPSSPLSPPQQPLSGPWVWGSMQHGAVNSMGPYIPQTPMQQQQRPTSSMSRSHFASDNRPRSWSYSSAPIYESAAQQMPAETFLPYMQLFFSHMFPIMPIIDRNIYLDPTFYLRPRGLPPDTYCFISAICAATIVQLDASIAQPPSLHPTKATDDLFAEECLRVRSSFDYVGNACTLSILTSFFLFAYYGNHEKHAKAWHYLQESITFAENLNLDDESSYSRLDPHEAQWRRRLYWLLFITERAYAVQRRKRTRLTPTVHLPAIFESEDPQLLNGFVNLANLFSAVNDGFVTAWRGAQRSSQFDESWLASTQKELDATALALETTTETQHLDIAVTREWLHVLAWQMGVSHGLIWGRGEGGMRLDYPIELARKVVDITSRATPQALDSHGIGMEQKLSDIAGCLADVLKCTAGDASPTYADGKHYLNVLLRRLSSMRGKESRYLKPLMSKMEGLMGYELNTQTLPLPSDPQAAALYATGYLTPTSQGPSMADSVGMLRAMSMNGHLGMPTLTVPPEYWTQRGNVGRVMNEGETREWMAHAFSTS